MNGIDSNERVAKGMAVDIAFRQLQSQIIDLTLEPGVSLEEQVLAEKLRLSRTPIREAIARLVTYGLAEVVPNRGARVAPLELRDAPELLETLELFQRASCRWAAIRRTKEDLTAIEKAHNNFLKALEEGNREITPRENYNFHVAISRSCGNRYLAESTGKVEIKTARLNHVAYNSVRSETDTREHFEMVCIQHEELLRAIKDGNADMADSIAAKHVDLFRSRLLNFLGHSLASEFNF